MVSRDHLLVNDFDFSHNSINYVLESLLLLLFHSSRDANEYNLELFNAPSQARRKASEKPKSQARGATHEVGCGTYTFSCALPACAQDTAGGAR